MKILLIEDDRETANHIKKGLEENSYTVDLAYNGEDGLHLALHNNYDIAIIDIMLPELDGLSIIKMLRAAEKQIPILVLSALGSIDDKVKGLKIGADDYLSKPYSFSELLARIEALIRRAKRIDEQKERVIKVGDLKIDLENYKVTRKNREIELKPREFRLLEYLARHKGQIVTRTMLLENVWNYNFDPQTNVIDVHISRLRQKIDKGFNKQLIKTVRGIGYKIEE